MLIRMGYAVRALAVTVPILYQWQTEVRTTTSVWKPHPITEGLGGVVHEVKLSIDILQSAKSKQIEGIHCGNPCFKKTGRFV